MQLTIPDDLIGGEDLSKEEILLHLALGLFIDRTVSLERAARIAGLSSPAFLSELGKHKIPVQYGVEDFESDLRTLESIEGKRESQ